MASFDTSPSTVFSASQRRNPEFLIGDLGNISLGVFWE